MVASRLTFSYYLNIRYLRTLAEKPILRDTHFRNNADLGKEFSGRMFSMFPENSSFFWTAVFLRLLLESDLSVLPSLI